MARPREEDYARFQQEDEDEPDDKRQRTEPITFRFYGHSMQGGTIANLMYGTMTRGQRSKLREAERTQLQLPQFAGPIPARLLSSVTMLSIAPAVLQMCPLSYVGHLSQDHPGIYTFDGRNALAEVSRVPWCVPHGTVYSNDWLADNDVVMDMIYQQTYMTDLQDARRGAVAGIPAVENVPFGMRDWNQRFRETVKTTATDNLIELLDGVAKHDSEMTMLFESMVRDRITASLFPFFDVDKHPQAIATTISALQTTCVHKTKYSAIGYWTLVETMFMAESPLLQGETVVWTVGVRNRLATLCADVVDKFILSNGCPEGRVERLAACWEEQRYASGQPPMDELDFDNLLHYALNFVEPTTESIQALGDFVINQVADPLVSLNGASDSGAFNNQNNQRDLTKVLRSQSFLSDTMNWNAWWSYLRTKVKQPDSRRAIQVLCKVMSCAVAKPKYEILQRAKIKKKVRNIMVGNAYFAMGVGRLLQGTPLQAMPQKYASGTTDRSLYGFSPLYGGMQFTMDFMLRECQKHDSMWTSFFYSDNMYIAVLNAARDRVIRLLSLDGKKMESGTQPMEALCSLRHLYRAAGLTDDDDEFLLSTLGGLCAVNTPVFMDGVYTVFPGLSSGAAATFYINQCRMAVYSSVEQLRAESDQDWGDTRLLELCELPVDALVPNFGGSQSTIRVEKTCDTDMLPTVNLSATYKVCSLQNCFEDNYCGDFDVYGAIVVMDMLGFDATPIYVEGKHVLLGCLNFERCMRGLMYRKTDKALEEDTFADIQTIDTRTLLIKFVQIMTIDSLCNVGGYAYEDFMLIYWHLREMITMETVAITQRIVGQGLTLFDVQERLTNILLDENNVRMLLNGMASTSLDEFNLTERAIRDSIRSMVHSLANSYSAHAQKRYQPTVRTRRSVIERFHVPHFEGKEYKGFKW